jgi:hypothetical protein
MITLTMKDEKRLEVMQRLFRGEVTALYELVEPRALFCIAERTSTL